MRVGGIILCGGRSSRMGQPKAWLPMGPEVMLQRVVRRLMPILDPVVVVAAPGQEVPTMPQGIAIVRDEAEGRGPLQGLAAGLEALEGRVDAAYLSACDVPFLRPAFVLRVIELLGQAHIAVPYLGDYHHPLAAVYRLEVLPLVRQLLKDNRLRPYFLFQESPTQTLGPEAFASVDPTGESLRNLNTPEDYAQALRDLRD